MLLCLLGLASTVTLCAAADGPILGRPQLLPPIEQLVSPAKPASAPAGSDSLKSLPPIPPPAPKVSPKITTLPGFPQDSGSAPPRKKAEATKKSAEPAKKPGEAKPAATKPTAATPKPAPKSSESNNPKPASTTPAIPILQKAATASAPKTTSAPKTVSAPKTERNTERSTQAPAKPPATPFNPVTHKPAPHIAASEALVLPPLAPRIVPVQAVETAPMPAGGVPINLDTVLRLSRDQSGPIALARERIQEALSEKSLADKRWLPDLFVGAGFYRHEGGIQDFDGQLLRSSFGSLFAGVELRGTWDLREAVFLKVEAARKVWQKQGELARLTSDNLVDAAGTYVDLLAARTADAVSRDMTKKLAELADRTRRIAKAEPTVQVEVARVETEMWAQQLISRKLREAANASQAKLVYLLGLDPSSDLVVVDPKLVPFNLVDVSMPAADMVGMALAQGPGIQELEGLLGLLEHTRQKAHDHHRWLPALEVNLREGAFGAGPGSQMSWDQRFDLALHARWNLTELFTLKERRLLNQAKVQQAHISYQDLRAKLSLGVQEAREAVLAGREQIGLGDEHIKNALEAYRLSNERLRLNVKGTSPSEVLLSIRALAAAQLTHVNTIREYDKAQLRLLVFLGRVTSPRK